MTTPKGKRQGGRQKGTPNKRTIEALRQKSEQAAAIAKTGKRATEVLNELMITAMSLAAREQRRMLREEREVDGDGIPIKKVDRDTYDRMITALTCAGAFAKALAPFQEPIFKAIAVVTPPPSTPQEPKAIDGKVIRLDDPVAVSRVYQQMVRVVR